MKISIIGFGVIGKGFAEVLLRKREYLRKRYDFDPKVVSISDISGSLINEDGVDLEYALKVARSQGKIIACRGAKEMPAIEAIEKVDSDVVLEVTPTNLVDGEPGYSHMLKAMELGKHVVTSNKGPLALYFRELIEKAKKHGVEFRYEASAGGAMPLINLARETLSGDEIISIKGILNGTTNFILTKMTKEEITFDIALKEARELGIAEADPSHDIEGKDTACKLVILANAIMNKNARFKDVKIQGIKNITPEAIKLAKENGYVIKLIGEVANNNLEVSPRLIPANSPLNVNGTLNVAMFETDLAKEIIITGHGAGAIETNSAILSDIISIWKKLREKW